MVGGCLAYALISGITAHESDPAARDGLRLAGVAERVTKSGRVERSGLKTITRQKTTRRVLM